MDVRRLQLLRELADRGSVTAVARATHRTASAVSQQLKVLETEVGVPLTERGTNYAGILPDTITIYRLPILRMCHTDDEVIDQVRITVVHEVAHHFGIDDERLHELGYG